MNLNFFDILWWVVVFIYSMLGLYYLNGTRAVLKEARQEPLSADVKGDLYVSVEVMPVMLIQSLWLCSILENGFSIPLLYCFRIFQVCICLGLWILVCICATIQKNTIRGIIWSAYMDKKIDAVLAVFTNTRQFLLRFERLGDTLYTKLGASVLLVGVVLPAVLFFILSQHQALQSILIFAYLILVYIFLAGKALHTCRRLLAFWLFYSILFAGSVAHLAPQMKTGLPAPPIFYTVFTLTFSCVWILVAGAADREPAKMGCAIMNTLTTIALIATQVLVLWAKTNVTIPAGIPFSWGMLQDFSIIVLLPLVVAGYMAGLVIELQSYWDRRNARCAKTDPGCPES